MKSKSYLNKALVSIVCILVLVIIVVACAPAKPSAAQPNVPAVTGPKAGGVLRVALPMKSISMDTFTAGIAGASASMALMKTMNLTPITWTGINDRLAKLAPCLAKSWEVSPDGFTYTLHIREGVKWQNTPLMKGREFTAYDMAYHMERRSNPANKHPSWASMAIKNIEVVDKYTVKSTTNNKVPAWFAFVAIGSNCPIPKEVVEAPGGADKNWEGTGPFILTTHDKDTKAIFIKNSDFWEKGKPYLDGVEFYFMPDPSARLAAFRAGQIDVLVSENKANRDAIARSVTGVQIQDGINMLEAGLAMNMTRKPFDSKLVRQAIQYAIDYDGLIKSAMDGGALRSGYLAPWFTEWGARQEADLPKRDIAKAKALLAEAGYPNGFKTTLLQNVGQEYLSNACEPIVAMLREVGIDASIITVDNAGALSKWRSKDYDMFVQIIYFARPVDPDSSFIQQWKTGSSNNHTGYSDPKMEELLKAELNAFPDMEKRKPIIKEIITKLEDDVPAIPLYIKTDYFIKQSYVKGWDDMGDPQGCYATQALPNVWIDKK